MCIRLGTNYVWKDEQWQEVYVKCGDCWQCNTARVNDFVGRMLCEAAYSERVCALTLTYAPNRPEAGDNAEAIITPSHLQRFIRSLRRRGHSVRYFAVAEKGELKGRVHFHALLFFQKGRKTFDIPDKQNTHIPEWPHGHVFADYGGDERALRYVCKYLLKNEPGKYWCSMSKQPPLGDEFFRRKADEYVRQQVLPSSFNYLPPGGSKDRPYFITGATRRLFLERLTSGWRAVRDLDLSRANEFTEAAIEKIDAAALEAYFESLPFEERLAAFAAGIEHKRPTMRAAIHQALDGMLPEDY